MVIPGANPAVIGFVAIVSTAVLLTTCAAVVATGWQIATFTPPIGRPFAFTTGLDAEPSVPDWARSNCGSNAAKLTSTIRALAHTEVIIFAPPSNELALSFVSQERSESAAAARHWPPAAAPDQAWPLCRDPESRRSFGTQPLPA